MPAEIAPIKVVSINIRTCNLKQMYNILRQLQLGFNQATLFLEFVDAAVLIHG